jgi:dihydrofolate synthase/folylpolyglutamate synthase
LGLDAVRAALSHFGDPQRRFRVAHIAGTNGKGSTAAFVASGLRAAGRRVGLYTSPHLHRFAERVQCDGEPVSEALLGASLARVLDAVERGAIPKLTLFEVTTVAAWLCFEQIGVDDVVLEVGLGGRLDATNVCDPAVCAITSIGFDHMALLGDTLAAIAREKAGILKRGVPYVLGPSLLAGEASEAILSVAASVGAQRLALPRTRLLSFDDHARAIVSFDDALRVRVGLAGEHQVDNAAVAVAVLRALSASEQAIAEGIEAARWPGRCERIDDVLVDCAHNAEGAQVLSRALEVMLARSSVPPERRAVLFGASADKRWREAMDALSGFVRDPARWFLCAASLPRATAPALLATHRGGVLCASVREGLARARTAANGGLVLVYGSIFVAAEARAALLGLPEDEPLGL